MSRSVTVTEMSPDDFNRFKGALKGFPHPRAAAREIFRAGLDAIAGRTAPSPVDLTTAETPVTPEDAAPAKLAKKAPAKRASAAKRRR